MEKLSFLELAEILGGGSNFCDRMQEIASTAKDWSDDDWDKWADSYERHCMS